VVAIVELPCNWLQCQENSLDPVHTEWLHGYAGNYFREVLDGREPTWLHRQRHEDIAFTPFRYGIIKHRATSENERDLSDGHPILFPNILLVGNPLAATMEFRVPMDDTHCLHFSHHTFRPAPGTQAPQQDVVPSRIVPLYMADGMLIPDIQRNQDFMCWITQGDIAKRDHEKLGESDKGIILFRKQLLSQVEILRDGGEPNINILRDPAMNECIELPIEVGQFSEEGRRSNRRETTREDDRPYVPQEAGAREFADNYANPLSLLDPQTASDFETVMRTWKGVSRERVQELITAVID
jgi:5,5'-dehydrodivanillate O-demethylase